MSTFEIIGACFIVCGLFIAYHMYIAPTMDEQTGRITKEGNKLSDLFKKKK
jgi:hypothetical protein